MTQPVYKKIYSKVSASISLVRNQINRRAMPAQLHDLFMLAKVYSETPSDILNSLDLHNPLSSKDAVKAGPIRPVYYDAGPRYLKLLTELISHFKPSVIVETGVANGASTSAILDKIDELERTISGYRCTLHSIDIDQRCASHQFKNAHNWTFHLLSKEKNLKSILDSIAPFDFFIHDSDHSYNNQKLEYNIAWSRLRSQGLLISDDISWSNAFLDFCQQLQLHPSILSEAPKVCGLVQKNC